MLFQQSGRKSEVRSLIINYCSWLILRFCFQHTVLALCLFFSIYAVQTMLFAIKWENTRKTLVGHGGNHVSAPQLQAGLSELLDLSYFMVLNAANDFQQHLLLSSFQWWLILRTHVVGKIGWRVAEEHLRCSCCGYRMAIMAQKQKASPQLYILFPSSFHWNEKPGLNDYFKGVFSKSLFQSMMEGQRVM